MLAPHRAAAAAASFGARRWPCGARESLGGYCPVVAGATRGAARAPVSAERSEGGAPHYDTCVSGGIVVTTERVFRADIGITGGKIARIAENNAVALPAATKVDATGLLVMPGGVDSHAHIAQPSSSGGRMAGDWASATRAAAAGGTTTVIPFSTQDKGGTGVTANLEAYLAEAAAGACVDYSVHMIVSDPTPDVLERELPALIASGLRSVKVFMTYPKNRLADAEILRVFECAREHGALVCVHAENDAAIGHLTGRLVAAGKVGTKYHAVAKPPSVEVEAVHRVIALAEMLDQPIQLFHVTCAAAADEVAKAQERGVKVFAETCTHYLAFTKKKLNAQPEQGARFLCSPALRTRGDQAALWEHLSIGTLDNITSDHAPYNIGGADGKFWAGEGAGFHQIANGMAGIQPRMAVVFSEGVVTGRISAEAFVALTSTNAAKVFGLYPRKGEVAVGSDADLVLWDPSRKVTITHDVVCDGVDHTPWEGFEVTGWPAATLSRGHVVAEGGDAGIAVPGWGELLLREPYPLIEPTGRRKVP